MESSFMPRSSEPRKVEVKINLAPATAEFAANLAGSKDTPPAELYRQAVERGLTAIAEDETKRNVWIKTSLRGELGRLINSMDEAQMEKAIEVLREIAND